MASIATSGESPIGLNDPFEEVKALFAAAEAREREARTAQNEWIVAREEARRKAREAEAVIAAVRALVPAEVLERAIQAGILNAQAT